jgi:hypothetical protein
VYIFLNIMLTCIKVSWLGHCKECGEECRNKNRHAIRVNSYDFIGAFANNVAHVAADKGHY